MSGLLAVIVLIIYLCYYCCLWFDKRREAERREAERLEREKFDRNFKTACKEFLQTRDYLQVLVRKRKQLIVKDDYGDWYVDDWVKEIDGFVKSKMIVFKDEWFGDAFRVLSCKVDDDYELRSIKFYIYLESVVETLIKEAEIEEPQAMAELDMIADPLEYENKICEVLINCGWNAQVTKASGDQGVDVIAELDGVRVAVQCKLYSSPVGNKAVQEVFAAKIHYDCQLAMVVTNSSYTKSAKQLASTCGVELLHHDKLTNWIETQT